MTETEEFHARMQSQLRCLAGARYAYNPICLNRVSTGYDDTGKIVLVVKPGQRLEYPKRKGDTTK